MTNPFPPLIGGLISLGLVFAAKGAPKPLFQSRARRMEPEVDTRPFEIISAARIATAAPQVPDAPIKDLVETAHPAVVVPSIPTENHAMSVDAVISSQPLPCEPLSQETTDENAPAPRRSLLAGWFELFRQALHRDTATSAAADDASAMAIVGDDETDSGTTSQMDGNGLLIPQEEPASTGHELATVNQLEREALAAAEERNRAVAAAQEEAAERLRLAREHEARVQMAAQARERNRWWLRINPDLDPDDVNGRLALATSLGALQGVEWAQRLLAEAIDQEPEPAVRARIYGVLARIGGATDRRALYEAALSREPSDRAAAIDAVLNAHVPWAIDFVSAIPRPTVG